MSAAELGLAPPPVANTEDGEPMNTVAPQPSPRMASNQPLPSVPATPPYQAYPNYPQGPNVTAPQTPPAQSPATPRVASRPSVEELQSARILARVDGAPILEGDIIGMVNQVLEPRKDQMSEDDYKEAKKLLTQRYLRNAIEMKMLYNWFFNTIPADKREKALATAWEQVGKTFDQNELPKLLERAEVDTPQELDVKLRQIGHSLAKQRRAFGEKALGTHVMLQNINRRPEVSYDEMIEYYRENEEEFAYKSRARWEQLTVLFSKHSRAEARVIIGQMGDAVFYGTPFPAVAKKGSEGFRAPDGGLHDWTQRGSLRSAQLDEAIFTLPLNKLSDIVEDDAGFHIIRVLDREEAGKRSFRETQLDIKEKIQQQKREKQMQEFLKKVRRESTVNTIYDTEPEGPLMERGQDAE